MNNFSKIILLFFVFIPLAFGLGSITIKSIDEITNNTGTDIVLKPVNDVKIDTFTGNFALQSGSLKEIEESSITNTELSYLTGLTSNAQSQITTNVSPTTTLGDIISRGASVDGRLAVGTIGQVLTSDGSIPQWEDVAGGVGGINFITNFDFELDASGWNQYNDGAVSVPIDCTGATGNGNTLDRNTTLPLYQTGDLKFVKAAVTDNKGTGFSTDFTIGNGYQTQMLTTEMLLDSTDAALDDGDMKFFIYDVTNAKLVGDTAGYDLLAGKPSQIFQWQASPDSVSYRFCAHVVTTETPPFVLRLDNITINQKSIAKAPVVEDWKSYTPTGAWTTFTTYSGFWKRVGDTMYVRAKASLAGAPNAGVFTISIPSGFQIDTSKLPEASFKQPLGIFRSTDNGVGESNGFVTYSTTTTVVADYFKMATATQDTATDATITQALPQIFAVSDVINVQFSVPIVGWSSNAQTSETLGGREIVVRGKGNTGNAITANTEAIDFTTSEDTTASWSQVGAHGPDTFTAPETGYYVLDGSIFTVSATSARFESYIDGNKSQLAGEPDSVSTLIKISSIEYLEKGQLLTVRASIGITLSNNVQFHTLNIVKLASPQTMLQTELVAARYTSNNGQGIGTESILTYEDLDYDTHGAYSSGVYTVPVTGKYIITASCMSAGNLSTTEYSYILIELNNVDVERDLAKGNGGSTHNSKVRLSTTLNLVKGDTFTIRHASTLISTLAPESYSNTFSIARIK